MTTRLAGRYSTLSLTYRTAVFAAGCIVAIAQSGPSGNSPVFEVASIKRSQTDEPSKFAALSGGRMSATGVSVRALIRAAYEVQDFQISGGASWIGTEKYTIEARGESAADASQTRLMLRALLAERFQLKIHTDRREIPALALLKAKAGGEFASNLTLVDGASCDSQPSSASPCGRITGSKTGLKGERVSMAEFAQALSGMLRRTVVDRTALAGRFNLRVDFEPSAAPTEPTSQPDDGIAGASAFVTALREQLGLKLETTKSAAEIIVIDSTTRPSDN
jgi:uncharacterized protein (TIGR03435 family)